MVEERKRNGLAIAYYSWKQNVTYNKQTCKFEKSLKGIDLIVTRDGRELAFEKWEEIALKYVTENDLSDLLSQIEEYVKDNCKWLKKGEIRRYALDCMLHESYKKWDDFMIQETMILRKE